MPFAALLAATLLIPLSPAPTACFPQESGSSPAQTSPAENPQNSPTQEAPPAKAADQKPPASQPDQTPAKEEGKPGAQKSPSRSPAAGVRKRRSRLHQPGAAASAAPGEPRKIVVHHGGASEPPVQIVPGVTQEEASHQRQTAEQFLAATEANLKQLAGRTLTKTQQGTVDQIRHYMDGARSALKDSDTQRAHTLAMKAYLLSDDLVKH